MSELEAAPKNLWLRRLLATIAGIAIAVVFLELVFQIYNPFAFRSVGDVLVLPANYKSIYENSVINGCDSLIYHSKNELGFRGPDMPNETDDMIRIVALGGSTTVGEYLNDDKDWPSRLSDQLNESIRDVWVNNAGFEGQTTFGSALLLADHVIPLEPDYVLFMLGYDDMSLDTITRKDTLYSKDAIKTDDWKGFLKSYSEIVGSFVQLRKNANAQRQEPKHASVDLGEMGTVRGINRKKVRELKEHHEIYAKHFARRLQELVNMAVENDVVPILITQPSLVGEGKDNVTGYDLEKVHYCHESGGKVFWQALEIYNDATRQVSRDNELLLIDLAQDMPKSTDLFYDCVHFTNRGAEIASYLIFEKMRWLIKSEMENPSSER